MSALAAFAVFLYQGRNAVATVTVPNVVTDQTGTTTAPVSSAKAPAPASLWVIVPSMIAVLAAIIGMWYAYKYVIKPSTIGFAKNYVPYAGVVAAAAALERLLEPLTQVLMQGTVKDGAAGGPATPASGAVQLAAKATTGEEKPRPPELSNALMKMVLRQGPGRETNAKKTLKQAAAESRAAALKAAADPAQTAESVQPMVEQAAADQASLETLRTNRAVLFWAIASILGVGISGGFGLFLLQTIATSHVNSLLDMAVTGLTIGAGTKPTHDLITSLQAKAGSSS